MRKLRKMITLLLAGTLLVGCGASTTPEIIMPDEPMQASAKEETTQAEEEKQEETSTSTSGHTG